MPIRTKAVAGYVDISPSFAVNMGCGPTNNSISKIDSQIEANAIIIFQDYRKILFISLDALYVGNYLRENIENEFRGQFLADEIFIAASHTHYAPQLDVTKPLLGHENRNHLDGVIQKLKDLIYSLIESDHSEVEISHSRFSSISMISRRRYRLIGGRNGRIKLNSYFLAPSLDSTPEVNGTIVRIHQKNKTIAYLWQLPCHPTLMPVNVGHHAHFPGDIRMKLRDKELYNVPVVFLQGFSGDLNPMNTSRPRGCIQWARRFVLGEWFREFTIDQYKKWIENLWEEIDPAYKIVNKENAGRAIQNLQISRSEISLKNFIQSDTDFQSAGEAASLHFINFGLFSILGVSAEVVSTFNTRIQRDFPLSNILTVGCIDNVFGYAPTEQMILQGGYESGTSAKYFGFKRYKHDFEAKLYLLMKNIVSSVD